MTRHRGVAVLTLLLLTGCDIDFVEVEESQRGAITVVSEQHTLLQATLGIALPDEGEPPRAIVAGRELEWELEDGHWQAQARLTLDTLRPRIEIEIRGRDTRFLHLPLVARNGAAVWRQNGDLELPVVNGAKLAGWEVVWHVELIDSSGVSLLAIDSHSAPLPRPLVLRQELVPAGAVAAEVFTSLRRQLPEAAYPLDIGIFGEVRIPVPSPTPQPVVITQAHHRPP